MFEITEKQAKMIKDYLKDKETNLAIRVMMNQGGDPVPHWDWLWMSHTKMMKYSWTGKSSM